jgi:hypothetical protein
MPDGQNQGPPSANSQSRAESPGRGLSLEIFRPAIAAPGPCDDGAGLFAPDAGLRIAQDASLHGVGPGQAMPMMGELWP